MEVRDFAGMPFVWFIQVVPLSGLYLTEPKSAMKISPKPQIQTPCSVLFVPTLATGFHVRPPSVDFSTVPPPPTANAELGPNCETPRRSVPVPLWPIVHVLPLSAVRRTTPPEPTMIAWV